MNNFENLMFWIKSRKLAVDIYKVFEKNNDFWFKNQILRAVISISNNIAEWFERQSNKEFKYFLFVSKWSCWEVRSMLYIAKDLWYIDEKLFKKFYSETIEISKMLSWFIKQL